ncbi:MAG: bifunctional oligoribonuclease/PAP phosphatase NrnA [Nitrospiraceae bacterium]|nr:bifunctional oligoribonuclease/PAP phosphatase NrnA [Nitrospiraceae bacterium]
MSEKEVQDQAAANVERIMALCKRPGRILILMQDNPDPDALASAAALHDLTHHHVKKHAVLGYGGICGRAENRAMIDILRIGVKRLTPDQIERFRTVCLVDTQPRSGNNILMPSRLPEVVVDHHLLPKRGPWMAEFADVRPDYGACSTIFYEYLQATNVRITPRLATALFYGIQSDTQDLGREANPADIRAYRDLFLIADKKKLAHIHHAPVPPEYFRMLADSLATCVVAGTTVVSQIPECTNADMIAEVADRLMRLEGMRAAVCYGVFGDTIHLSARALDARGNCARRMKRVVARLGSGGGHRSMAGGQIPINGDAEKRLALVQARILKAFAPNRVPVPLCEALPPGGEGGQSQQ